MTPEEAIEFLGSRGSYFSDASFFQAVNALRELVPKESPSDCIRVRIAVAVDEIDNGVAQFVCHHVTDERAMKDVVNDMGCPIFAQAFIEADIPRISTIKGRVVEVKNGE